MICHQVNGAGQAIGPDLSGAGAMGIDALLHNILMPNEQLESGYYRHDVTLKDGTFAGGFLASENKNQLVLRQIGADDRGIGIHRLAHIDDGGQRFVADLDAADPRAWRTLPQLLHQDVQQIAEPLSDLTGYSNFGRSLDVVDATGRRVAVIRRASAITAGTATRRDRSPTRTPIDPSAVWRHRGVSIPISTAAGTRSRGSRPCAPRTRALPAAHMAASSQRSSTTCSASY